MRVIWTEGINRLLPRLCGRQVIRLALAFGCLGFLGACTSPARMADQPQESGKPLVLTTFTVLADMARNVA
ncbi:MAG: metal ABC transporter substrate-binding protein, partial [Prochlorococcaceae cyanobacterium ETNP2_MAG_10]|nr:metal ABC transporter substrate-binding protein [Prochlorococcaceae cyanobacterium ETNP2_MAG_10]